MAGLGPEQPDLPMGFVHQDDLLGDGAVRRCLLGFVGYTEEEQGRKGPKSPPPGSSPTGLGYFRAV